MTGLFLSYISGLSRQHECLERNGLGANEDYNFSIVLRYIVPDFVILINIDFQLLNLVFSRPISSIDISIEFLNRVVSGKTTFFFMGLVFVIYCVVNSNARRPISRAAIFISGSSKCCLNMKFPMKLE